MFSKEHKLGNRKFKLFDVYLKGSKVEQNKKYMHSKFYRNNLRQGNTIIEKTNGGTLILNIEYSEFARKGIPNIFELKLSHIRFLQSKQNVHLPNNERSLA